MAVIQAEYGVSTTQEDHSNPYYAGSSVLDEAVGLVLDFFPDRARQQSPHLSPALSHQVKGAKRPYREFTWTLLLVTCVT